MDEIDFEALFSASPNPYVLLDPAFNLVVMNEAYLQVTMRRRDDVVGRNMFEAFPSDPQSDSHRQLRTSLEKVISTHVPDHIPLIHYNISLRDGRGFEERYWSATHSPVFDSVGNLRFILQHTVDVTELHRLRLIARSAAGSPDTAEAENDILRRAKAVQQRNERLEEESRNLRSLFEQAPGFVAVLRGPEHIFAMANDAYRNLVGNRDIRGKALRFALPEVVEQGFLKLLDDVYTSRQPFVGRNVKVLLQAPSALAPEERFLDFVYQPIVGNDGECTGVFVQGQDVTEQHRAESALRESEERFRLVAENAPVMLWMGDTEGRSIYLNEAQRMFWGVAADEIDGFDWPASIHAEDRDGLIEATRSGMAQRAAFTVEARFRRADGRFRMIRTDARPRFDATGAFVGMIGVNIDVTDERIEEERRRVLLALSDRFREAGEPADLAFAAAEILGRALGVSRAGYGTINPASDTITIERSWNAPDVPSLTGTLHFRDFGSFIDDLKLGKLVVFADAEADPRTAHKAEALKAVGARSLVNMPVMEHGVIVAILFLNQAAVREWTEEELSFIQDVADRTRNAVERRRAENDLMALAAELEDKIEARTAERNRVWRNSRDILVIAGTDGILHRVNPAWSAILGLDPDDAIGRNYLEFVWHEDSKRTRTALERAESRWNLSNFENRFRHADGTPRWILWHTSVEGDFVFAYGRDVTAEKTQGEALRQAGEQLRQAQKMEALGQLTGGVAHDFNNLLQVISGNLHLLGRDVAGNERAERRVEHALSGVNRGAKLASQLLAFSRRQALEPKVLNVGRLVTGMGDMLRRTIGEAIEIDAVVPADLWNTLVDPAQIENAILNLAINSRDAMNGAGRLTIATANAVLDESFGRRHDVAPGDYVELSVTDTGSGIPPEIVSHVFEPFFSTKPLGKGTGLGLSMVYGLVRQSGGYVKIDTALGRGTTIRLYLPRAEGQEEDATEFIGDSLDGGHETILVAEDDESVRTTVVEMLSEFGYRILTAKDAATALSVIESGVHIDLLFTDVVMPGPVKTTDMVVRARILMPEMAVLFTSGYTENSIVHGGRLDAGVELLSKPYTRDALARKIRYVLSNQKQANRSRQALRDGAPGDVAGSGSLTILLVEDDALIRMDTADVLSELGHNVLEASSAEQAISIMQQSRFDILFTDIGLPGLSGGDLAVRVREEKPSMAVIFATGNDHAPELAGKGVSYLLRKPYTMAAVESALRTVRPI